MKDNYIQELTSELIERLPELEWKINTLNLSFINRSIPKGLFKTQYAHTAEYINELKNDIYVLSLQTNLRSAHYLAERIKRKISVLVNLCRIQHKRQEGRPEQLFSIAMLNTRQQWLHSLEHEVQLLIKQQQALAKTLKQMQKSNATSSFLLNVQSEVGAVEKKLTIAQERLNKAYLNGR